MIALLIILNILIAIWCWRIADDVEPGTIWWFIILACSAWNAVEAIIGIISF